MYRSDVSTTSLYDSFPLSLVPLETSLEAAEAWHVALHGHVSKGVGKAVTSLPKDGHHCPRPFSYITDDRSGRCLASGTVGIHSVLQVVGCFLW